MSHPDKPSDEPADSKSLGNPHRTQRIALRHEYLEIPPDEGFSERQAFIDFYHNTTDYFLLVTRQEELLENPDYNVRINALLNMGDAEISHDALTNDDGIILVSMLVDLRSALSNQCGDSDQGRAMLERINLGILRSASLVQSLAVKEEHSNEATGHYYDAAIHNIMLKQARGEITSEDFEEDFARQGAEHCRSIEDMGGQFGFKREHYTDALGRYVLWQDFKHTDFTTRISTRREDSSKSFARAGENGRFDVIIESTAGPDSVAIQVKNPEDVGAEFEYDTNEKFVIYMPEEDDLKQRDLMNLLAAIRMSYKGKASPEQTAMLNREVERFRTEVLEKLDDYSTD